MKIVTNRINKKSTSKSSLIHKNLGIKKIDNLYMNKRKSSKQNQK